MRIVVQQLSGGQRPRAGRCTPESPGCALGACWPQTAPGLAIITARVRVGSAREPARLWWETLATQMRESRMPAGPMAYMGTGLIHAGGRLPRRRRLLCEPVPGRSGREDPSPLLADFDCAVRGSGPAAPRLPRALSSRLVHRAAGACAMDQCPGARDLRPGGLSCWFRLTLPVGGRAAACCGARTRYRAGRGWRPGLPHLPGRREPSCGAAGWLRFARSESAARSCRGEHDAARPPREPGEDDPGGRPRLAARRGRVSCPAPGGQAGPGLACRHCRAGCLLRRDPRGWPGQAAGLLVFPGRDVGPCQVICPAR